MRPAVSRTICLSMSVATIKLRLCFQLAPPAVEAVDFRLRFCQLCEALLQRIRVRCDRRILRAAPRIRETLFGDQQRLLHRVEFALIEITQALRALSALIRPPGTFSRREKGS